MAKSFLKSFFFKIMLACVFGVLAFYTIALIYEHLFGKFPVCASQMA